MENNKGFVKIGVIIALIFIVGIVGIIGSKIFLRPYDTPEYVKLESYETGFLIPVRGDTNEQLKFESEEFLDSNKVATKEVEIPHYWSQTGRLPNVGEYRDSAVLIKVNRSPVTREWTDASKTGTSSQNQAIVAESKDSIGFTARFTATAQVGEKDTARFLYKYQSDSLDRVMDTQIRAKVETAFTEQVARYKYEEVIANKKEVVQKVKDEVIPYFKKQGITITVLGQKGELTPLNKGIQEAINAKFIAEREKQAQELVNERLIAEAEAKKKSAELMKENLETQVKKRELENRRKFIEQWDGRLPKYMMGGDSNGLMMQLPTN